MPRSPAAVSILVRKLTRTLSQASSSLASKEICDGRGAPLSLRDISAAEREPPDRTHWPYNRIWSSPGVRTFASHPSGVSVVDLLNFTDLGLSRVCDRAIMLVSGHVPRLLCRSPNEIGWHVGQGNRRRSCSSRVTSR